MLYVKMKILVCAKPLYHLNVNLTSNDLNGHIFPHLIGVPVAVSIMILLALYIAYPSYCVAH